MYAPLMIFFVVAFLQLDLMFCDLQFDIGDFSFNPCYPGSISIAWNTPRTTLGSTNKTISSTYFYGDLEEIKAGGMKLTSVFDNKTVSTTITEPFKKGKRHKNKGRKFNLKFENINGSRFRLRTPELFIDIDED